MVRPVCVVILIHDSVTDTLLTGHEAAVPLTTAYNKVCTKHSRFPEDSLATFKEISRSLLLWMLDLLTLSASSSEHLCNGMVSICLSR